AHHTRADTPSHRGGIRSAARRWPIPRRIRSLVIVTSPSLRRPTTSNQKKRGRATPGSTSCATPHIVDRNLTNLQDPAYRPARPPRPRHLHQRASASVLTRRNAIAASLGFSILLDIPRPSDGPRG